MKEYDVEKVKGIIQARDSFFMNFISGNLNFKLFLEKLKFNDDTNSRENKKRSLRRNMLGAKI